MWWFPVNAGIPLITYPSHAKRYRIFARDHLPSLLFDFDLRTYEFPAEIKMSAEIARVTADIGLSTKMDSLPSAMTRD